MKIITPNPLPHHLLSPQLLKLYVTTLLCLECVLTILTKTAAHSRMAVIIHLMIIHHPLLLHELLFHHPPLLSILDSQQVHYQEAILLSLIPLVNLSREILEQSRVIIMLQCITLRQFIIPLLVLPLRIPVQPLLPAADPQKRKDKKIDF